MLQEIPELDAKGLRRFALIFALIIVGVFGVIIPIISGSGFLWIPWLIGGIFIAWGVLAPPTVRPFYRLWMRFGLLMNAIISRVVLGIVFIVLLPYGLVFRLRGKDSMHRAWDHNSHSYRVPSHKPSSPHMEKPY